jgi:quinol monooxygenase YgiN
MMGEQRTLDAGAGGDTALYVVDYCEVISSASAEAAAQLRNYRDASRTETGLGRLEVLQQRERPNQFAIVAHWRDEQAFEAHAQAAHTQRLHNALRPLAASPVDQRLHTALMHGTASAAHTTGATYVVTHADAIPPAKDDAMAALRQLAEASRNDRGNRCFDVWQQRSRQNHFTLVEIWQDQQCLEAHVMAAHTRQFREVFQPMTGSLYDARLYQALD